MLKFRGFIVAEDRLYAAEVDTLMALLGELGEQLNCVMLFGHNPELTELAQGFSNEIDEMPTCAVARFTFDAPSWSTIAAARLVKAALDYPKKD